MLLFWIRDHPTQCSIDSFKATNYNACWCDHMEKWVYHHKVIYPNTIYQTKYPMSLWSISNIFQEFTNMHVIIVQNRCITTFSKLWRLYSLYGFNLSLDLVNDFIHILSICLFKRIVTHKSWKRLSQQSFQKTNNGV